MKYEAPKMELVRFCTENLMAESGGRALVSATVNSGSVKWSNEWDVASAN